MPGLVHAILVVRPDGRTPAAFHLRSDTGPPSPPSPGAVDELTIVVCGEDENVARGDGIGSRRIGDLRPPVRTRFAEATRPRDARSPPATRCVASCTGHHAGTRCACETRRRTRAGSPPLAFVAPKLVRSARSPPPSCRWGSALTQVGRAVGLADGPLDQGQHDVREDVLGADVRGILVRAETWRDLGGLPDGGLPGERMKGSISRFARGLPERGWPWCRPRWPRGVRRRRGRAPVGARPAQASGEAPMRGADRPAAPAPHLCAPDAGSNTWYCSLYLVQFEYCYQRRVRIGEAPVRLRRPSRVRRCAGCRGWPCPAGSPAHAVARHGDRERAGTERDAPPAEPGAHAHVETLVGAAPARDRGAGSSLASARDQHAPDVRARARRRPRRAAPDRARRRRGRPSARSASS